MNIEWKKAEGELPHGEVLALSKDGSVQIGSLRAEGDGSWTCESLSLNGDWNEYERHIRWYIPMDTLLAIVPKENL